MGEVIPLSLSVFNPIMFSNTCIMKNKLQIYIAGLLTLLAVHVILLDWTAYSTPVPTDEHVIYEDDFFHLDYQIDLKQDHYIIIDEYGQRTKVAIGELEQFFLDDNL